MQTELELTRKRMNRGREKIRQCYLAEEKARIEAEQAALKAAEAEVCACCLCVCVCACIVCASLCRLLQMREIQRRKEKRGKRNEKLTENHLISALV